MRPGDEPPPGSYNPPKDYNASGRGKSLRRRYAQSRRNARRRGRDDADVRYLDDVAHSPRDTSAWLRVGASAVLLVFLALFAAFLVSLGGCSAPWMYTDPRACLFCMEYGHWPRRDEPEPSDAGP